MRKRIISLFLMAALCVGMLPNMAWAAEESQTESGTQSDTYVIDEDTQSRPAAPTGETLAASDEESTESVARATTSDGTTVYCDDLQTAIDTAGDNGTVKLLKSLSVETQLADGVTLNNEKSKGVTLDLNGCGIEGNADGALLTVSQDMTIYDSVEAEDQWYNGSIYNRYSGSEAVCLTAGHLTLKSGRLSGYNGSSLNAIGGSLTIENGWLEESVYIGSGCPVTISGGIFDGQVTINSPGTEISGGSFTTIYGVTIEDKAKSISGGTFVSISIKNSSKVISGGSIDYRLKNMSGSVEDLLVDGFAFKHGSKYDGAAEEWLTESERERGETLCVDVLQAPIQSVSLTSDAENNTVKYGEVAHLFVQYTYVGENNARYTLYQNDKPFYIDDGRPDETFTLENMDAGTYKYRVEFTKDGYSKSAEITITIEPIDITAATVTTSDFTYDGTAHTPDVTVKLGDKTLEKDTDYDVSVDKQTDAGSYKLTITGKGNYTGTKVVDWTIQPKTLTITDAHTAYKRYDGTTDATVESVTFDGLIGNDTLTLGEDFTATGAFDSANAGSGKTMTITVKLNDNVKNYTLGQNSSKTFENWIIDKGSIPFPEVQLTIINGVEKTYEVELPDLPELDAPKEYGGNCTYTLNESFHLNEGYEATAELDDTSSPKKLKLHFTKAEGNGYNLLGFVGIRVETDNFDETLDVDLFAKDKTTPYLRYNELILSPESITYGDTLDSIKLSGEMKDEFGFVSGTFSWVNGSEKPPAGEYEAKWLFTPTDEIAHNKVTDNVLIKVNKAKFTNVSVQQDGTLTYTGEPQRAAVSASGTGACGESATFRYGTSKDGDDFDTQVPAFTNAGKYTVYYQAFDAAGNHEVSTGTFTVTIDPKTVDTPTIELTGDQTYTGKEITPAVTVKDGETVIPDTEYEVIYTDNINAGTATVTLTNKEGGNYIVSGTTTFEIGKADSVVATAPTTNALTYNGTEQALVTAGEATGGTMMYSLTENGSYSSEIPTCKDAKTYTVWYKVTGDSNHNDTAPQSVEVTIAKAAVTVTVKDKSAYTGSTAPDLSNPVQDTDYTVSGLFGEDTLTGTIALAYDGTPDMTKTGETTIKITGTLENENYTVSYVDGKLTVSARSSGGHGSSSSSSSTVSASKSDNGSVSLDKSSASKGSTVTVTVKAKDGYKLDKLIITDAKGNTIEVTDKGDGKFSFVMPDGKVTVTPTFVADNGSQTESKSFNDVKSSDWYADAVQYVSEKGLMSGTGSDKFAPNDTTTRAMLMTVLARYAGEDTSGGATWYEKGMNWAKANGVSDGTNPNANITREQLVTMLYRYAGSPAASGSLSDFSDSASVSSYAVNAMQWAVANGIVNGSNGKLNPQNNATRAEVAAILMRFCEMSK